MQQVPAVPAPDRREMVLLPQVRAGMQPARDAAGQGCSKTTLLAVPHTPALHKTRGRCWKCRGLGRGWHGQNAGRSAYKCSSWFSAHLKSVHRHRERRTRK